MKLKDYLVIFPVSLIFQVPVFAQLNIDTSPTATQLAQLLAGPGVTVSNASYSGAGSAKASFQGSSNLGISKGIVLCTGKADSVAGPNNRASISFAYNRTGDAQLNSLAGTSTYDAAILEFDFVPQYDSVRFRYVFGSDEYPEYVGTYNDAFGFFISGPGISGQVNLALIPGTSMPVSIQNVNANSYSSYYVDNGTGSTPLVNTSVQYDGFTVVMKASSRVIPCMTYHIKIAIGDAKDSAIDSGVLLEAYSMTSKPAQTTLCSGGSASIGIATLAGYTFTWSPSTGLSHPNNATTLVTLSNNTGTSITTNYILKGSNGFCVFYDTFAVTVKTEITVDFSLSGPVCLGNMATILFTGNAPLSSSYSWNFDGGTISSGIGPGPYKVSWNSSGHKTISLKVISGNCSSIIRYDSIQVRPSLIVKARSDSTICHGQNINLFASSSGGDSINHFFTWQFQSFPSASWTALGTGSSHTVNPEADMRYRVILADNCTMNPDTAYVLITVRAPLNINPGRDTTICAGQSVIINTSASGGISTSYHVEWDQGLGSGNNFNVSPVSTTTYTAILTDGCSKPDTAAIKIILRAPLQLLAMPDTKICQGQQLLLTAAALGGDASNYVYAWDNGLGNGNNKLVSPTGNTTYQVVISDNCSPLSDTGYVNILVEVPLNVVARPDTIICAGRSLVLYADGYGGKSSAHHFNWDLTGVSGNYITVSPAVTTTYRVILSDNCTVSNDTAYVKVEVRSALQVTARPDTTICKGQSLQLYYSLAGGNASTYYISWEIYDAGRSNSWMQAGTNIISVNPSQSTLYRVILADGCTAIPDTDYVTVTVRDALHILPRSDSTICIGQSIKLFANATGGISQNYVWSWDQGLGTGKEKFVSPVITTTYRIILTDNCTTIPDTAYITINVRAQLKLHPPADTVICSGQQVKLIASGSGGNPGTYHFSWDNGAGPGNSITTNIAQTYIYNITLTDNCTAGEDKASVTVTVREPLKVQATPDSITICAGQPVHLSAVSFGGLSRSYNLTWNNGLSSGSSHIVYPVTGTIYQVILSDGCSILPDTGNITVIVKPPLQVSARKDTFMCSGETTHLYAFASGGESSFYSCSWYRFSGNIWNLMDTGNYIAVSPGVTTRYRVILSDDCSDNDTAEVIVNIRIPLKLSITPDTVICRGQSANLVVSGAGNDSIYYSYLWNNGLGPGNYKSVSPLTTTTYQLLIRDNCAATTDTASVKVIVRDPLRLFPRSDSTICKGQTIKLFANAQGGDSSHYTFGWDNGMVAVNNGIVHPDSTTIYRVILTDHCSPGYDSGFVKITVRPGLVLKPQPDTTICYGQSLNLSVTGEGGYSPWYNFSWNNGIDTGASILILPLASAFYQVILTDKCSFKPDTALISVHVRAPLNVTANSDTTICRGQKVLLQASANGGVPVDYVFKWTHVPVEGNSSLVSPNFTTTYRVVLTDHCSFYQDTATVKVTVRFPLYVYAPKDTTICSGKSLKLTAKGYGGYSAAYNYSWDAFVGGNWQNLSAFANESSLNITPAITTLFRVVLKDNCTLKPDTDYVWVIVRAPLQIVADPDTTICLGQQIQISVFASGGNKSTYLFAWNNGLGNSATHTINPVITTRYRVILSDNCSTHPDTTYITVNVREPLEIFYPGDTSICKGQSVKLNLSGKGGLTSSYLFAWDNGAGTGNSKTVSPLENTSYMVILSDNCSVSPDTAIINILVSPQLEITARTDTSICKGQQLIIFATAAGGNKASYHFSWDHGLGNKSSLKISPAITTTYRVILSDNCSLSPDTDYVTINVRKPLDVNAGPGVSICYGESVVLNATGSGGDTNNYNFMWNGGLGTGITHTVYPLQNTNYRVILTDNCSSQGDTAYVQVLVKPPLKITARPFIRICSGDDVLLFADGSGGDPSNYFYSWDNGVGPVKSVKIKPEKTATYTVTLSDGCSLPATDTVTVELIPLPWVEFTVDANRICLGEKVKFINKSGNANGTQFTWYFDGKQISDEQPVHTFYSAGTYSAKLKVVSPEGCSDSLSRKDIVTVNPLPHGQFVASPGVTNILSPIIQFDNYSEGAVRYDWDLGDGKGSSTQASLNYEYEDTGTFNVKMVAYNDFGCIDTAFRQIKIADVYRFFVPNSFTPNGDGLNETFHPTGMGIRSYETRIYNRWGQMVYESSSLKNNWNGNYFNSGDKVPQEIYQYTFKVIDFEGKPHYYQGSVMLLSGE